MPLQGWHFELIRDFLFRASDHDRRGAPDVARARAERNAGCTSCLAQRRRARRKRCIRGSACSNVWNSHCWCNGL